MVWWVLKLLLIYLVMGVALRLMRHRLIFFPSRGYPTTPSNRGVASEDVWLTTGDGVRIFGWLLRVPDSRRTILFLHGNAGNIADRLENGIALTGLGMNVLLLDYRGYGASEGSPTEEGTYRDADAAHAYLMSRPEIAGDGIVIFGRSVGAGPAVDLAARSPCAALVVESAFTSVRDLAAGMVPYNLFLPMLPVIYDSVGKIGTVKAPVFVLHGTRDEIIPFAHGKALFEAAPEPKHFFEIRGAYHNDWYQRDPDGYFTAWREFLGTLPATASIPRAPAGSGQERSR